MTTQRLIVLSMSSTIQLAAFLINGMGFKSKVINRGCSNVIHLSNISSVAIFTVFLEQFDLHAFMAILLSEYHSSVLNAASDNS